MDPAVSFGFASAEDLPEDSPPDAVPRVLDPGFAAVPEAVRSEFRRMLAFIVYLFPQPAGSPSVPPPRVLFSKTFSPPLRLLVLHRSILIGLRGFSLHSLRLTLASPVLWLPVAETFFFFLLILRSILFNGILRWVVRLR